MDKGYPNPPQNAYGGGYPQAQGYYGAPPQGQFQAPPQQYYAPPQGQYQQQPPMAQHYPPQEDKGTGGLCLGLERLGTNTVSDTSKRGHRQH
ncbi:hypothetical protein H4R33_002877 [Dimargaris cristalligena]|nr:hypothetical protein H4R33_002877 [Dimargaris cristalligena]